MIQPTLLELAKQGNATAIAALINRQTQSRGILARASLLKNCLQIIVESDSVPPQQELVTYIWNAMNKLEAASIEKVKVYGKKTGSDFPVWDQEFELKPPQQIRIPIVAADSQIISPNKKNRAFSVNEGETILECNGSSTVLTIKERGVVIKRLGGFMGDLSKGEKFIAYKNIVNIQIYPSSTVQYGFIYFQTILSSISHIQQLEAVSNPDTVIFYHNEHDEFDGGISLILENTSVSENIISLSRSNNIPQHEQKGAINVNLEVNGNRGNQEEQVKCPKCSSTQVNANKKGFDVTQAVLGGIITGGIGLAAGLWGRNEIRINCLKCGHRWKP